MSENQLRKLSIAVGQKLQARGQWITCAESCTGGGIAKAITDIAGSSAYFDRGFVTYSNAAKHELLGVAEATLKMHGAVSEDVVREMAQGALKAAKADLALSVSGIAGPDGGSDEKPVGTVWFGFAERSGRVQAHKRQFAGDRDAVRLQATIFALQMALDEFL
ncbi:nicotinamide-nucleotide amidase [Serratia fonticola]|uniref:Nicotinamide-nucleotide amidase n=1 Tax=Serratia fonticola TaxID=47917 RepID=A0A559T1P6_SERFO|nr:nicotinamide-nucleotide amidase [Serratia fonticola]TQI78979.1 nicotinamide-nucleotide amidase [Serratia fonticola]TQI98999.1 nicotinamide-nucleotide amidase [Serratia fonticola]TVZ68524.1 nicotinamide-nucleotide amidase [Serratia fonticola]